MHTRNRLVGLTIALSAMVALIAGCQSQDSSLLTEADRTIEPAGEAEDTIIQMIKDLIGDPVIERSTISQFNNIVKSKSEADRIKRAQALFDYLTKHYLAGKWVDEGGVKTAELILAIGQYVGLYPPGEGTGAMCQPGSDCEAEPTTGLTTIPANLITQPFTLIMTEVECDQAFPENFVPPCYEITTYPEGINFEASASTSLSLSAETSPFVAICADFAQNYVVGEEVFLWHLHDGVLEQMLNSVPYAICDPAPSELSSRWANPLFYTFQPVLSILSPQPLYAAGTGVGIGTAISNFSQVASCLPGCFPTTTTASILEGTGPFFDGDTITIRAVVDPAPSVEENPTAVFIITPVSGGGAPAEPLVDGVAEHEFVCGSTRVPFGSHTAGAAFLGTGGYGASDSGLILAFDCLELGG